jgi:ketosteroid isomerase-like protein
MTPAAAFYAPDGRFMVPNAPIAEGREAVAAMWGCLLSLPNVALTFGPTQIEAAASGDLAFEIGTYALGFDRAGAARVEDRGKYVVVRKRLDGAWKAGASHRNGRMPNRPACVPALPAEVTHRDRYRSAAGVPQSASWPPGWSSPRRSPAARAAPPPVPPPAAPRPTTRRDRSRRRSLPPSSPLSG